MALICILISLNLWWLFGSFFWTYFVIDEFGVCWSVRVGRWPKVSRLPWRKIVACAGENECDRRVLRLFLRRNEINVPPSSVSHRVNVPAEAERVMSQPTKIDDQLYVDIGFDLANDPNDRSKERFAPAPNGLPLHENLKSKKVPSVILGRFSLRN